MTKKERSKKVGSLKIQPLKGQFFDLKPAPKSEKPVFAWVKDYSRFALISFLAFVALNVGNAYVKGKDVVFESSNLAYAGYGELQQGIDHLLKQDGENAIKSFLEAQKTFKALQETTKPFTSQVNGVAGRGDYLETADTLIKVALEVSEMGEKLASFTNSLKNLPDALMTSDDKEGGLIQVVHEKKAELRQILDLATALQQKLVSLDIDVLPLELQQKVTEGRSQIGQFLGILMQLDRMSEEFLTLLGDRVPHRYLILLQNNHELRATGGFIGSYLIVDVNDGKITKMETNDIYQSDGWLSKLLPAPEGINQVSKYWYMRDANYSPDFPTSAEQLMWFLEQSRGPSVDTVVAIDQTLVEEVLKLMGDIQLENFPEAINAENFNRIISFYTEAKLSETNTPKQLLFDLIPRFKEKAFEVENLPQVLMAAQRMVQEGHIQFYSKDPDLQTLFESYGLSGEVIKPQEKLDYLNIINTSIGGNKTDEFIETNITHTTLVEASGSLSDELRIQRKHTFDESDNASIQSMIDAYGSGQLTPEDLTYILGGGHNKNYMRVYVPLGSQIEDVKGLKRKDIQVTEELGYTVFGFNYGPIASGQEREVVITYNLPFELDVHPVDNYRFVAQKQAGAENITLHKSIKMPQLLSVKKAYPQPQEGRKVPVLEGNFDQTKLFMTAISIE